MRRTILRKGFEKTIRYKDCILGIFKGNRIYHEIDHAVKEEKHLEKIDRYYLTQFVNALLSDEDLYIKALNNSPDNFQYQVKDRFNLTAVTLFEKNLEVLKLILDDKAFAKVLLEALSDIVYRCFTTKTDIEDREKVKNITK